MVVWLSDNLADDDRKASAALALTHAVIVSAKPWPRRSALTSTVDGVALGWMVMANSGAGSSTCRFILMCAMIADVKNKYGR